MMRNAHRGIFAYSLLLTAAMGHSLLDAILRAGVTAAISLLVGFIVNWLKARRRTVPD